MTKWYYIYIMANRQHGSLYVGMTSDLIKRVYEHRNDEGDGFMDESGVPQLVYYEQTIEPRKAIARENRLKEWKRSWQIWLIEDMNPEWKDLWFDIIGDWREYPEYRAVRSIDQVTE